jgi:hypothetical protein
MENNNELEKKLYESLKQTFNKELTTASVVELVTVVISIIQKDKEGSLTPSQKKQMALNLIKLSISDANTTEENKKYLNQLVDFTVPSMIDVMISVAKNEIDLGKAKENIKTGCFCL